MYLHGLAGDFAAAALGQESMLASDIIKYLPQSFRNNQVKQPYNFHIPFSIFSYSCTYVKVTFLSTGTSQGVPLIGCQCIVCQSPSALDKRLRSSIHIENQGQSLVIDSGPDFRQQMLRADIRRLDGLVFTHGHKDHTAGFDDIRAFNYIQQEKINVYATLKPRRY